MEKIYAVRISNLSFGEYEIIVDDYKEARKEYDKLKSRLEEYKVNFKVEMISRSKTNGIGVDKILFHKELYPEYNIQKQIEKLIISVNHLKDYYNISKENISKTDTEFSNMYHGIELSSHESLNDNYKLYNIIDNIKFNRTIRRKSKLDMELCSLTQSALNSICGHLLSLRSKVNFSISKKDNNKNNLCIDTYLKSLEIKGNEEE